MASTQREGKVLNVPSIQIIALLCSFPSIFGEYEKGALWKYYN